MKIPTHLEFVEHINAHLRKTGESARAFGGRVMGDSASVIRLRQGVDPKLSTMLKIAKAINGKK